MGRRDLDGHNDSLVLIDKHDAGGVLLQWPIREIVNTHNFRCLPSIKGLICRTGTRASAGTGGFGVHSRPDWEKKMGECSGILSFNLQHALAGFFGFSP